MKVRDIVEYGMLDEPSSGVSKAAVRKQTSNVINQTKRANNQAANANDEVNIKNAAAQRSQNRAARIKPTGIPMRAVQPQEPQQ